MTFTKRVRFSREEAEILDKACAILNDLLEYMDENEEVDTNEGWCCGVEISEAADVLHALMSCADCARIIRG